MLQTPHYASQVLLSLIKTFMQIIPPGYGSDLPVVVLATLVRPSGSNSHYSATLMRSFPVVPLDVMSV